jgi:protoheme IX farnesyltransferase
MLPVVKGTASAARQIVAYSVLVLAASLALVGVSSLGWIYGVAAGILGIVFVVQAVRLHADPTAQRAIRFFMFSNTYLALLFAVIAVDTLVRSI